MFLFPRPFAAVLAALAVALLLVALDRLCPAATPDTVAATPQAATCVGLCGAQRWSIVRAGS
jgi:hypothetical protein